MLLLSLLYISMLLSQLCEGRNGVDLSIATDLASWKCLQQDHNITYAKIRVYRNIGEVDTNSALSIKLAIHTLGNNVDAYIFPCITTSPYSISKNITCSSAEEQVDAIIDYLADHDISFDLLPDAKVGHTSAFTVNRLWLDIEDQVPSKYFDSNIATNTNFLSDITNVMIKKSIPMGIYTTKTYWTNIMGNILGYDSYPLWYPKYDSVNDMSFFVPFAGWEVVNDKQTNGNVEYCGLSQVDSDYMLD